METKKKKDGTSNSSKKNQECIKIVTDENYEVSVKPTTR